MYFIKIDGVIQEYMFKTKRDAVIYIVDFLRRLDITDPVSTLKKASKTLDNNQDTIIANNYTFVIFIMHSYTKCCICEGAMKDIDILDCQHPVCKECLKKIRKNECPICRKTLSGKLIDKTVLIGIQKKMELDKIENEERQHLLASLVGYGIDINELYM